jgi:hypothetical protein
MAIMTISVTERTREIGVRQAIGARRREILVQFLIEAAVLTSVGGILGVLMGSAIGLLVNVISGFPVSLPWWSFALGLGFSASIGIFFGMLPAWRASRLDPIEALRHGSGYNRDFGGFTSIERGDHALRPSRSLFHFNRRRWQSRRCVTADAATDASLPPIDGCAGTA